MSVPTNQEIFTATFEDAITARNKKRPINQWKRAAFFAKLEAKGFIKREFLKEKISVKVDYRQNPDGDFLATETQAISETKRQILKELQYTPAQLVVPVSFTDREEALTGSDDIVDLIASKVDNAQDSVEQLIESKLFSATVYNLFNSLPTAITANGEGTVGEVDAASETWHQNQFIDYGANTEEFAAKLTTLWNDVEGGTGLPGKPTLLVSDAATQGIYESLGQVNQRWVSEKDLDLGFTSFMFKNAPYIYSDSATSSVFMISPEAIELRVAKNYWMKQKKARYTGTAGEQIQIGSFLQLVVKNRSRLGVAWT